MWPRSTWTAETGREFGQTLVTLIRHMAQTSPSPRPRRRGSPGSVETSLRGQLVTSHTLLDQKGCFVVVPGIQPFSVEVESSMEIEGAFQPFMQEMASTHLTAHACMRYYQW